MMISYLMVAMALPVAAALRLASAALPMPRKYLYTLCVTHMDKQTMFLLELFINSKYYDLVVYRSSNRDILVSNQKLD